MDIFLAIAALIVVFVLPVALIAKAFERGQV